MEVVSLIPVRTIHDSNFCLHLDPFPCCVAAWALQYATSATAAATVAAATATSGLLRVPLVFVILTERFHFEKAATSVLAVGSFVYPV